MDLDPLAKNYKKMRKIPNGGDIFWYTKVDKQLIQEMLDKWGELLTMVK